MRTLRHPPKKPLHRQASKDTFPEISGATNLRGHYVPIVVGGIKHMDPWVKLYRMVKKAV